MRPWEKKKAQEVPPAYTGRAIIQPKPLSFALIAFNSVILRPAVWLMGMFKRPMDYSERIKFESRIRRCELDILFLTQTIQNEVERNRELMGKLGVPFQRYRIAESNERRAQQNDMLTAQLQGVTGLPIPGELLTKVLEGKDIRASDYMSLLPLLLPLLQKAQQGQVAASGAQTTGSGNLGVHSPPTNAPAAPQGQPEGEDEDTDEKPA
jgi:hypothetical protein